MSVRETAGHLVGGFAERARAYVEIQNGCDHRCTFCVIPFGRGNARSVPAEAVVGQVRRLAAAGCRGGADRRRPHQLGRRPAGRADAWATWWRRILKLVPELARLRLSSIDAAEIDADLMRCLAEEPRLMPHLHLSLQAGDDLILKRMKRRHCRADALALIAAVRRVRPDTAFGADLIAGFPTETDGAVRKHPGPGRGGRPRLPARLPVQPAPGTPAARMPQLPRPLIKERGLRLRAAERPAATWAARSGAASSPWWNARAAPGPRTSPRSPSATRRGSLVPGTSPATTAAAPAWPPGRSPHDHHPSYRRLPMRGGALRRGRRHGPRQRLSLPHVPEGLRRLLWPPGRRPWSALDPGDNTSAPRSKAPTGRSAASAATAARRSPSSPTTVRRSWPSAPSTTPPPSAR